MTMNSAEFEAGRGTAAASVLKRIFSHRESGVFLALVAMIIIMSFGSPYFLKEQNVFNVMRNMSSIMVMAIGMTMIIITGGIDLSIGATLAVTSMIAARMMVNDAGDTFLTGFSPVPAFAAAIVYGLLSGIVIGLIITKLDINPFITTLGVLSINRGLAFLFATGIKGTVATNIPVKNELILFIGIGRVSFLGFEIPMQVIIMIILVVLFSLFLKYTVLGRQIYAVGANSEAARLTGVNVTMVKIFVYTVTGVLCTLAGFMNMGLVASSVTNAGVGTELDVIAAVAIGGASMSGGEGTILGTVIGAAIMAILRNAFVLLHLPIYLQTVSIGIVIILAVAIDGWRRRRATK